jgi:4-oxalmesaconate hydratase
VRGIDPESGHYFDDTKRYIDHADISAQEKANIFEHNIRAVFPRINNRF